MAVAGKFYLSFTCAALLIVIIAVVAIALRVAPGPTERAAKHAASPVIKKVFPRSARDEAEVRAAGKERQKEQSANAAYLKEHGSDYYITDDRHALGTKASLKGDIDLSNYLLGLKPLQERDDQGRLLITGTQRITVPGDLPKDVDWGWTKEEPQQLYTEDAGNFALYTEGLNELKRREAVLVNKFGVKNSPGPAPK